MTPEEIKAAAKKELIRRGAAAELARREAANIEEPEVSAPPKVSPGGVMGMPGIVEPLKAMLSGQAMDAVGGIAGLGQIPLYNLGLSDIPPEQIVKEYQGMAYQPKSPEAIENMQGTAQLLQPLADVIDKTRTGEKTFQAGGGPLLSTVNEIAPELVGAMLGYKGIKNPPQLPQAGGGTTSSMPIPMKMDPKTGNLMNAMSRGGAIRTDLAQKKPIARTARYRGNPGALRGFSVDKAAKKAVSQGWDESFVSWAKTADKQTRSNLRKMVNIAKRRVGETKEFDFEGRPSDVLGESMSKRINLLRKVQKQSGGIIDRVARKQLTGKQVDISQPLNEFRDYVVGLGGRVNEKGKLVFGIDSNLFGQTSKQKALRDVLAKIEDLGDLADGYKAHELKQFITEYVDFGKAGKDGISSNIQVALKKLRGGINGTLKNQSSAYDKVNTAYSETTQTLSDFQKAAGSKVDLFGGSADAAIGQEMRKLVSNYGVRQSLKNSMEQVEALAAKHGGKYTDDLLTQNKAVKELERVLGSFAEGSFKGEITQAGQRIAENPGVAQTGREVVRLSAKQLRKMRQNETTRLKALEELLYQGGR